MKAVPFILRAALVLACASWPLSLSAALFPDGRLAPWAPNTTVGVPGGMLLNRGNLIDVTKAPYSADNTGATDASTAIQNAINASPAHSVIYLPAGRYRLDKELRLDATKDNRTIRGAGMNETILDSRSTTTAFSVGTNNAWNNPASGNVILGGLAKGSTEIMISDTTAFSVGQIMQIVIPNDPSLPVIQVSGTSSRLRQQKVVVTGKTATTVKFSPALYRDYTATTALAQVALAQTDRVGIENLTVDCTDGTTRTAIFFDQCYACWIWNIKVTKAQNYSIFFLDSLHCELRKSHIDEIKNAGSNGAGLLVNYSAACLIEDNIIYRAFPLIEINAGSTGNVFAYNFCEDSRAGTVVGAGIDSNHAPHNSFNLFEGNIAPNIQCDGYFGGASHDTIYRNWLHGTCPTITTAREPILLQRFTRYYSVVGNLLGRPGYAYHSINGAPAAGPYSLGLPNMGNGVSIGTVQPSLGSYWKDWELTGTLTTRTDGTSGLITTTNGYGSIKTSFAQVAITWDGGRRGTIKVDALADGKITFSGGSGTELPAVGTSVAIWAGPEGFQELDLDVQATLVRKGNYDLIAGSIPAEESLGSDTLLPSLFRTSKPAWFGSLAWPAFNPLAPAASYESIPAGYRYVNGRPPPTAAYALLQPTDVSLNVGTDTAFATRFEGYPTPSLNWQMSTDGGTTWSDLSESATFVGTTSAQLEIKACPGALHGNKFRCAATNSEGTSYSDTASLSVTKIALTISGLTSPDKIYDATTNAPLDFSAATLVGAILAADVGKVAINPASAKGTYATKLVGSAKPIFVSGVDLSGSAALNYTLTQPATTGNVLPAPLSVAGVSINTKTYDGTTAATLNLTAATLSGLQGSDAVSLGGTPSASFTGKTVGTARPVTITGFSISGIDAANYQFSQPSTSGNIDPKTLTVSGLLVVAKTYDRTTAATLDASKASLVGVVGTDAVSLQGGSGQFADKMVANNKPVTVSGLSLGGADAGNYSLQTPTPTGDITAKALLLSAITVANKTYDGNTSATFDASKVVFSGLMSGDSIGLSGGTATFADKKTGTGKAVGFSGFALNGPDAANYSLQPYTTTANISPRALSLAGLIVANKTFDGTINAVVDPGSATLVGVVPGEIVTFTYGTALYASANAGTAKTVTVSGLALAGADAANYTLPTTVNLTADILPAPVTITLANLIHTWDGSPKSVTATTIPLGISLSISYNNAATPPTAIGSYLVVARSSNPNYAGNASATLSIHSPPLAPPVIVEHPRSQTVLQPNRVALAVVAEGTDLTFQWRKAGTPLAGATTAALTLERTATSDAGAYDVIVSNGAGSQTSNTAILTIETVPSITTQPASQTVGVGNAVTLSVVASGLPAPTYQWFKNGAPIGGATAASYTLARAALTDTGDYTVSVANRHLTVVSTVARLSITPQSYAGAYFGSFAGGGNWALYVTAQGSGTYLAFLPQPATGLVTTVLINSDGSFTASGETLNPSTALPAERSAHALAAAATTFALAGKIERGQITGTLSGQTMSGAIDQGSSSTAGSYRADGLSANTGTVYAITGPSGQTLIVTKTSIAVDSAQGSLDSSGRMVTTTTTGATLTVTVATAATTLQASYVTTGGTTLDYFGSREDVASKANLANFSIRSLAGQSDQTLIIGFTVMGRQKNALIRGVGPGLESYGVRNVLADPVVNLRAGASQVLLASNNDWSSADAAVATQVGAFALAPGSRDAAIVTWLDTGTYTTTITDQGTANGVALLELYDVPASSDTDFANVSARAQVGTDESILIAGFSLTGNSPSKVLVRAIGPALTGFGVNGVLANPRLQIISVVTGRVVAENDNWEESLATTFSQTGAFALPKGSLDAALLVTLAPGGYTAHISGQNGGTGVALVELYRLP